MSLTPKSHSSNALIGVETVKRHTSELLLTYKAGRGEIDHQRGIPGGCKIEQTSHRPKTGQGSNVS